MHLLTIILLGISSNLDTLGIGFVYGCRKMRLPFTSNLLCGLIPCIGTVAMMLTGHLIQRILPGQVANLLGSAIIILLGVWTIIKSLFNRHHTDEATDSNLPRAKPASFKEGLSKVLADPSSIDYDYSGCIELKEALILAIALSLNNIINGIAAGVMNLNIFLTAGVFLLISLLFFPAGIRAGSRCLGNHPGKTGDLIAGLLLIIIGIYELFI